MSHWLRTRWWVVAAAVVVVVAAVVTVVAVVGDEPELGVTPLARVLDADVGVDGRTAFDVEAGERDVAYFAYTIGELPRVAAYQADTGRPLWTFEGDATVTRLHVSVAGDVLLLFSTCKVLCPGLVGLDRRDGKRLWTSDLPVSGLIGAEGGHAALQLTDGQFLTDAAGVDLRTGEVTWRIEETGGHDRYAMVPGTPWMAHYAHAGELRLVDLATGRATRAVPAEPATVDDAPDLYVTAGEVVLTNESTSTVYAPADLTERWSRDTVVRPIAPGLLYVSAGDHGDVVDGAGHPQWRVPSIVFVGAAGADWGFTRSYQDSGGTRSDYLALDTGRRLAQDDHAMAYREAPGVLLVDALDDEGSATFSYLALPSGERAELGSLDVLASTCAFGPTLVGCLDTRGRLGLWRYR